MLTRSLATLAVAGAAATTGLVVAQAADAAPRPSTQKVAAAKTFQIPAHCDRILYQTYGGKRLPVSGLCGHRLDGDELVTTLRRGGFSWKIMPDAVATVLAESYGYSQAFFLNRAADGHIVSIDRGLWQINDYWHPQASRTNLYDPKVATVYAHRLALRSGLTPWNGYKKRATYTKLASMYVWNARQHGVR